MKKNFWALFALLCILLFEVTAQADYLDLPEMIKEIEAEAFMGDTSIDSVYLPEGLETIGSHAFAYSSVEWIYMPESLTYIAPDAFEGCENLEGYGPDGTYACNYFTEHEFPYERDVWVDDFLIISWEGEDWVVDGYYGKDRNITIPSTFGNGKMVTSISSYFHSGNINSVFIETGIKRIEDDAFARCPLLKKVNIPQSVEYIGDSVFSNSGIITISCEPGSYAENWANLHGIMIDEWSLESEENASDLNDFVFNPLSDTTCEVTDYLGNDPIVNIPQFDADGRTVIAISGGYGYYPEKKHIKLVLPDTIEQINQLFPSCYIFQLYISKSVSFIDANFRANSGCSSVIVSEENKNYEVFNQGLYDTRNSALVFQFDSDNYAVNIREGTRILGEWSINCGFLDEGIDVVLPESLEVIERYAFSTKVKSVDIPKNVYYIGEIPFVHLGYDGFEEKITLSPQNPYFEIYDGCLYSIEDSRLICALTDQDSFTIREGTTSISTWAFGYLKNCKSISIPETVNYIGFLAFGQCSPDLELIVQPGSYAETYAIEENLPYNSATEQNITGAFSVDSISINSGEKKQVAGSATANNDVFSRVTLTINGYNIEGDDSDRYATVNLSGLGLHEINLADYPAFSLDTTRAPLNVPGTYTVNLWAKAERSDTGVLLDSMTVTVESADNSITGTIEGETLQLNLGESALLFGNVTSSVLDIQQVRLSVSGWTNGNGNDVYSYDDFSGHYTKTVDLQYWLAFLLDTDKTPFNMPGTYTVILSANAVGQSSFTELDSITVTVVGENVEKPIITFPANDHDNVEYGAIPLTWQAVTGAKYYMVSLRDLDTDQLLVYHADVGSDTEMRLSNEYFHDDHDYRVAIGAAVPENNGSGEAIRWSERIFHVLPEVEDPECYFTINVYQAGEFETTITKNGRVLIPRDGTTLHGVADCKVIITQYIEGQDEEKFIEEVYTNQSGTARTTQMTVGEKYTISYVKDNMTFFTQYTTTVTQSGENIINGYCYADGYTIPQERPFQQIPSVRPKGLYAEYFAFTDKKDTFAPENKRNETIIKNNLSYNWKSIKKRSVFSILEQYEYDDTNHKGAVLSTVNFVEEKFAAMFNGYIQLGGNGSGNPKPYKFRVTGDDGVSIEIEANDYIKDSAKDWGKVWLVKHSATASFGQNTFEDGTVIRLMVKYYNDSGDANLKLEYSHDVEDRNGNRSTWYPVPADWFYAGSRQVWITDATGIQTLYQMRKDKVIGKLENYAKTTTKGFINDIINSTIGSVVDDGFQSLLSEIGFDQFDNNNFVHNMLEKMVNNVENKLTRSIYGAVAGKLAGTASNESLWREIYEKLAGSMDISQIDKKDLFSKGFDTFLMYDQARTYMKGKASHALFWDDLNLITDLYVSGGSDNIKDADQLYPQRNVDMLAFFETEDEINSRKRQEFVEDVQSASKEAKNAIDLAKKGYKLISDLKKEANVSAATLSLIYAEQGQTWLDNKFYEAAMQADPDWLFYQHVSNPFGEDSRAVLEEKLMYDYDWKMAPAILAEIQGENLEVLLYQETLAMTLDAVKNEYVKVGKTLLK